MSIRRHLNAINGLFESISDDPLTNEIIEKELAEKVPHDRQDKVLELLEILRVAGRNGISPQEWADRYKTIRPDETEAMSDLLKLTYSVFSGICVERVGKGVYRWILEGTAEVDQHIRNAVENSVSTTSAMMAKAKSLGEFHISTLVRVGMAGGLDSNTAMLEAMKLINHFPHMFKSTGGGNYKVAEEEMQRPRGSTNYSELFTDIANRANPSKFSDEDY